MCGRFSVGVDGEELWEQLGLFDEPPRVDFSWRARFNVAPTQRAPVIGRRPGHAPRPVLMAWGLVPGWSRDGRPHVNARSETAADKPAFREAMQLRRCVVPVDGFYEWTTRDSGSRGTKRALHIRRADRRPFLLAGLWGERPGAAANSAGQRGGQAQGGSRFQFTILTRESAGVVRAIHDRMPCVLRTEDAHAWVDPDVRAPGRVQRILDAAARFGADGLERTEVGDAVGSVRNDGPECLRAPEPTLFADVGQAREAG